MTNRSKKEAGILRGLVWAAAGITAGILIFIIVYVGIKGIPHLGPALFARHYTSKNVSLFPALVNTVIMTGLSLIIAVPLGIGAAIYLVEYAKKNSRLVAVVRLTSETLTGIPSIVYGIFGMLLFVTRLHWGYSMLAGACTLALMILPVVMRAGEEALTAVPDSYREGSFGLGAGKLQTVFHIVLPAAAPGIFAGIVLGVGRIVGETAALIYTAGTVAQIPAGVMGSGRTLAVHLYALWTEGMHVDQSYATAAVLLVMVILLNLISSKISARIARQTKETR